MQTKKTTQYKRFTFNCQRANTAGSTPTRERVKGTDARRLVGRVLFAGFIVIGIVQIYWPGLCLIVRRLFA